MPDDLETGGLAVASKGRSADGNPSRLQTEITGGAVGRSAEHNKPPVLGEVGICRL